MLPEAREIARGTGPFSSVSVDATRSDASGAEQVAARFRAQAESLARRGAPDADIDAIRDVITSPPGRGGPLTRLTVARRGEVLLDLVLPGFPPRDECAFGPAPHLLPVARSLRFPAPYLVVDVDRAGADIEVVGELGAATGIEQVEGSHELLHKVPAGGWSHWRMRTRVEDSWDRNAAEVAAELDRVVGRVSPRMVLVDGDSQAVSALVRAVGGGTRELIARLGSGGRAAGIDERAHRAAIEAALDERARADRAAVLERFAGADARAQEAVQGLTAVVDALRRDQVHTLLLHDDPTSTATLWSGPGALQIGTEAAEVAAIGVPEPERMRADAVLTRAVAASGGDIVLLEPDDPDLADGIGALLRWSDRSTPHAAAPAMPGHGQRPGA